MELNDFKSYLEKEEYDKVYDIIVNKTFDLIKKIAAEKNVDLEQKNNKDTSQEHLIYHYMYIFKRKSSMFRYIYYIMNNYSSFNCDEIDEFDTKEKKLQRYIDEYNSLEKLLDKYLDMKKSLEKFSFEDLINLYKQKFTSLYKEMLIYKKKTFDEDISFEVLSSKVNVYYQFYREYIEDIFLVLLNRSLYFRTYDENLIMESDEDPVEVIYFLKSTYEHIKDEYKKYAYYYKDIELEEDESYRDRYNKELDKIEDIFKEMLKYRNIEYKEDEDFTDLKIKVMEEYPYLEGAIRIDLSDYPGDTYIISINKLYTLQECLLKRYKNYDEEMKNYQEYNKDYNYDEVDLEDLEYIE